MSGECQTKNRNEYEEEKDDKPIISLDEGNLNTNNSSNEIINNISFRGYCPLEDLRYWPIYKFN